MLEKAGFGTIDADNITTNVLPTWEHCNKLVSNPVAQMLLFTKGEQAPPVRRFVQADGEGLPRRRHGLRHDHRREEVASLDSAANRYVL